MSSYYNITRVGLPLTTSTVTAEYIDIVSKLKENEKWIGVMTSNDEKNSPAGYKVLRDVGVECITLNVWQSDRDPGRATISLLRQLKQLHSEQLFDHVILFTPGSPYIDDGISKVLLSAYDDIKVIDTKGGPQIAAEFIESLGYATVIRDYHDDFVLGKNVEIDRNVVSVFSCLQQGYVATLSDALNKLQPSRVIVVSVGEEVYYKEYMFDEIVEHCDVIQNDARPYSFAFIFDN